MTTEPKHTPGPWSVGNVVHDGDPSFNQWKAYIHCGERIRGNVVAFACNGNQSGREACEANAALIASAPSLLADNQRLREALRKIEHRLNGTGLCLNDWDGCREIARAALSATEKP